MPSPLPRGLLAAALLTATTAAVAADPAVEKQKAVALENLKKAEVGGAAVVESDHLIVCAMVPEAKAKALAASLDKVYALARKTLKYEDKEKPFPGKLTVYSLPDRQYRQFIRSVVGERPGDSTHLALKGDEPFVVVTPDVTDKATDADVFGEVGVAVAAALFARKSSTEFPDWVRGGFARATSLRAEGPNSRRYMLHRTQARTLALGGRGKPGAPIAEVWGGRTRETEVLATSLMDYLAYGPGAAKFDAFLNGFRGTDSNPMPGVAQAIEAAGWKEPQLEAAWKKWIQTGR